MSSIEQAAAWAKDLPENHREAVIRLVTAGIAVLIADPAVRGRMLLKYGTDENAHLFKVKDGQLLGIPKQRRKGAKTKV